MFTIDEKNLPKKAVAYYRHSAEDKQENSVPIQREHAVKFASQHGIEIIHEEADEGISGLSGLDSRPSFKRLFEEWIENPKAPKFDYVLVLDESRWGRFQNPDEAGHLQFRCSQQDKQVIYIDSGFPRKDQPLMNNLATSMKRAMAAEYSRNLSEKVIRGCIEISRQGYSAGGCPCYGMARMLLDAEKKPMYVLKPGEHKAIANARVTFVPAEDGTKEVVQDIFAMFVKEQKTMKEIAEVLNEKGIPSPKNKNWDDNKIARILTNESYIGTKTYNKTWHRLKQKSKKNPKSDWVIVPNAFPAIIDVTTFNSAQETIHWMMTKHRKGGYYLILRTQRRVEKELTEFLIQNGIDPNESLVALNRFPIIYSVALLNQSSPQWCFVVPDKMMGSNLVLGVGIGADKSEKNERIFAIPTNELGLVNFCMFSEKDDDYSRYFVKEEQVGDTVLSITKELINAI